MTDERIEEALAFADEVATTRSATGHPVNKLLVLAAALREAQEREKRLREKAAQVADAIEGSLDDEGADEWVAALRALAAPVYWDAQTENERLRAGIDRLEDVLAAHFETRDVPMEVRQAVDALELALAPADEAKP